MTLNNVLTLLFIGTYVALLLFLVSAGTYAVFRERKAKDALRASILRKFQAGIELTAQDVRTMAKGSAVPTASVNRLVYRLLHDTDDLALYARIKALSVQLEKEEPFDELPEEVKPALLRLVELCDASPQKSDHALLSPIQKSLSSFVELRAKVEKSARIAKLVNAAGIASLLIGVWGTYLSWRSPGIKDIEAVVNHAVQSVAQPTTAPSAASGALR